MRSHPTRRRRAITVLQGRSNAILLAAALVAGLAIGFAASTLAYRYKLLHVPGENLVERMNRALSLTPSQREQIGEVMEDTRAQVMQMRRNILRQRRRLMIAAYLKIRALLNPDQQKKFDDEFIPPKFRTEARETEQGHDGSAIQSSPTPSPSP
jgi:Spy/CpxP family protein refolding chaperone